MKRILLFFLFVLALSQAYANITQGNYRWRNDDGTETSATWKAAENMSVTLGSTTEKIRLRFNITADPNNSLLTYVYLYYNKLVSGSTVASNIQITAASTADFMLAGNNLNVTDGQPTTAQMSGSGTFVPGKMVTSSDGPSLDLNAGQRTEYEWLIKPGNTIQSNAQYDFYLGGGVTSTRVATLFTSSTLPLILVSFSAQPSGDRILLQWTTTQETGVSRFEIEKSRDGSSFSTIGRVPVSDGTGVKKYSYTDNAPFTPENYYRLKIVDEDGTFRYSTVYRTKPGESKNISLKVFPNPVKDRLNIRLAAPEGPVQIIMHDVSGRTLKVFNLHSDGQEMSAVAETSGLLPGIYFIKLGNDVLPFLKD